MVELPQTNTGLLILREDGELVSSAEVPEAVLPDLGLPDEPMEVVAPRPTDLSLTDDLALPAPPPLPPPIARARPEHVVADFDFSAPPPPPPPVFMDRPSPPAAQVIVGSPIKSPAMTAGASAPRVTGKTVGDSGQKPLTTRIVGVPSTEDVDVVTTPRRMPAVRPRPIKERDRRGPGEVAAALPNVAATPATAKAEALFLQALTDHQMGNDAAAENGIKLALTYVPGEPRYQDALKRLKNGQLIVD